MSSIDSCLEESHPVIKRVLNWH